MDFDLKMKYNVYYVQTVATLDGRDTLDDVLTTIVSEEATVNLTPYTQIGTLMNFHQRLGHLSYDTVKRMAMDPHRELSWRTDDDPRVCHAPKESRQKTLNQERTAALTRQSTGLVKLSARI